MKKIWVLTLFPEYFTPLKSYGVIGKVLSGERANNISLTTVQIAEYSEKSFKGVDASPYGGGPGVVMRADVLEKALIDGVVKKGCYNIQNLKSEIRVIYTSPRGEVWDNIQAKKYGDYIENDSRDLVFICGRYEGIDERFIEKYIDEIICMGDYVLSGGEIAVLGIIDSSLRFLTGSLGNKQSAILDSFEDELIEGPCYTRPQTFGNVEVPNVLRSGNHAKIEKFNHDEKMKMTKKHRPDLYNNYILKKGNK